MSTPAALVTGGNSGIGLAVAQRLAKNGFDVVISGRREEALKEAADSHDNISYVVADARKSEDAKRAIGAVQERHGRLDVLVNNAGVAPGLPLAMTSDDHVDSVFETNVRGVISTTREALPLLGAAKGQVINISSAVVQRPIPGMSVYSASKAALSSLTKAWARELAPEGIRVNAVNPGPIETPLFDKAGMTQEEMQHMAAEITQMVPMQRFGQVEEVANVVAFLASPEHGYITGSEYNVDGGFGS
jgi:NAD(P)-dependent dehydrogenase (short-subunit alcohol dehydrogenase family)